MADEIGRLGECVVERRGVRSGNGRGSGETSTGALFGNLGAATLNLRNLGDNRTLVLLDGRRMQPSTTLFAVDVDQLPASLIENVEVITGGASAVYGSDAVAGVVNFKLKHNFEGLQIDARGTAADSNGYGVQDVPLVAGSNLADHRGNVTFSANYYNRNASLQRDIPFYQKAMQLGTGAYAYQFLGSGYFEPFAFSTNVVPGASIPNFPSAAAIARALMSAPNYGAGYTLYPGGPTCTSGISPFIDDSAVSDDCKALLDANATNTTTQKQDAAEAVLQGKIV